MATSPGNGLQGVMYGRMVTHLEALLLGFEVLLEEGDDLHEL